VRFDNRIRGFMTNTTLPVNIPRARIDGWTLGYEGRIDALALRANVESLEPRNEANGRQLPRRARQQVNVGADYGVGAWRFGGSLLHVGSRFDDAANKLPLAAYTTADAYADWQFTRDWSLQAKVNNLTDKHYETAHGYVQAGRSFYVTLRWQPK
jgi:vitamin B12 transporter